MKTDRENTYTLAVNGNSVQVSREVYEIYEEQKNDSRNRKKRDKRNRLVSYNNLDTEELSGEEIITDHTQESTAELAERSIMTNELYSAVKKLEPDEWEIINLLFFQNMSERQAAKMLHVPYMTLHDTKRRILCKLHELLKN